MIGLVINSSLSILIDGSIINEAVVIIDKENGRIIHCYPCNANVDVSLALHDLALSLVRKNISCNIDCYVALITSQKGIITIPISNTRTLSVYLNSPFIYKKVANELLYVLRSLASINS